MISKTVAWIVVVLMVSGSTGFLPCRRHRNHRKTALASGMGIATHYTWKEEAFEMDVSVPVPRDTRAKDITFKATTNSIDLRLHDQVVLLDGSRKLRGRVNLDGTFWVISDAESSTKNHHRLVTVTIEKLIPTPRDDFEVIDYDWKGVYWNDTTEVSQRQYDEPEEFNVREYAASLGVDIDNINMSMVDKTLFSSGMNLTQSSLDELSKAGLVQEITRQADGKEYQVNEDGQQVPFVDPFGQAKKIPFLDTPWQNNQTILQQKRNLTRAAFAEDKKFASSNDMATDPIDTLTVKRLQEILQSQGLTTTGTKKELQDRLRNQVNALLQGKQEM